MERKNTYSQDILPMWMGGRLQQDAPSPLTKSPKTSKVRRQLWECFHKSLWDAETPAPSRTAKPLRKPQPQGLLKLSAGPKEGVGGRIKSTHLITWAIHFMALWSIIVIFLLEHQRWIQIGTQLKQKRRKIQLLYLVYLFLSKQWNHCKAQTTYFTSWINKGAGPSVRLNIPQLRCLHNFSVATI